jgi:hypothetical protein
MSKCHRNLCLYAFAQSARFLKNNLEFRADLPFIKENYNANT